MLYINLLIYLLFKDEYCGILLAKNKNIARKYLLKSDNIEIQLELAHLYKDDEEFLDVLSVSKYDRVKRVVARNTNNIDVLKMYCIEETGYILFEIAKRDIIECLDILCYEGHHSNFIYLEILKHGYSAHLFYLSQRTSVLHDLTCPLIALKQDNINQFLKTHNSEDIRIVYAMLCEYDDCLSMINDSSYNVREIVKERVEEYNLTLI